jgi:hypothetical protein
MQVERTVKIGSYSADRGLQLEWSPGFEIDIQAHSGEIVIRANKTGLISLAQHMLTLAEESVPSGTHIHLDASRELEDASLDLVIERAE